MRSAAASNNQFLGNLSVATGWLARQRARIARSLRTVRAESPALANCTHCGSGSPRRLVSASITCANQGNSLAPSTCQWLAGNLRQQGRARTWQADQEDDLAALAAASGQGRAVEGRPDCDHMAPGCRRIPGAAVGGLRPAGCGALFDAGGSGEPAGLRRHARGGRWGRGVGRYGAKVNGVAAVGRLLSRQPPRQRPGSR